MAKTPPEKRVREYVDEKDPTNTARVAELEDGTFAVRLGAGEAEVTQIWSRGEARRFANFMLKR